MDAKSVVLGQHEWVRSEWIGTHGDRHYRLGKEMIVAGAGRQVDLGGTLDGYLAGERVRQLCWKTGAGTRTQNWEQPRRHNLRH